MTEKRERYEDMDEQTRKEESCDNDSGWKRDVYVL
jgi:hypothetical protein